MIAHQSVRPDQEPVEESLRRAQAMEWIARQLRWEQVLAELHDTKPVGEAA